MSEKEERKLFSRMELFAMCMLSAANAAIVMTDLSAYSDQVEARKSLEEQINKMIDIRWLSK